MSYFVEPLILNTDNLNVSEETDGNNSLYGVRHKSIVDYDNKPLVSIYVQAYNRIEKTKRCVENILKYTQNINYELMLVDNGSDDGTYEYFQSIEFVNKKIVRVTKNIGSGYPTKFAMNLCDGKFITTIANDVYVTENWLKNMLNCIESDMSIGMVVPMSTNVSNLQEPQNFIFKSFEEMQEKASIYNAKSDPSKYQERLRLITIAPLYRCEVLDIVGGTDPIFYHDFGEDDMCARVRRSGYKMMIAGDTVVCHDHDFRRGEDKNIEEFNKSIENGRKSFKEKYYGIDAWDDILNFDFEALQFLSIYDGGSNKKILGIDVKCGQPILSVSNKLRELGIYNNERFAFTTKAKYFEDLHSVCNGDFVNCDRIEFLSDYYSNNSIDYIIMGEPINMYNEPGKILTKLMNILKVGGNLIFKLRNTIGLRTYMNMAGQSINLDEDMPLLVSVEEIENVLKFMGVKRTNVAIEPYNLNQEAINQIGNIAKTLNNGSRNNLIFNKLIAKNYCFCVCK